MRISGEEYLSHPLEVAYILTEMRMDEPSIVAGFLHDVVEDTAVYLDEIKEIFGSEVAFLVDGVTKLSKFAYTAEDREAENFRKMLISMAKDIRVILIKLGDRLHNIRTLGYLSEEKQLEKAKETLEIYAPIAHRLGIYWIKSELEDISFKYLKPEIYRRIEDSIVHIKKEKEKYIENVKAILRDIFMKEGLNTEISGRFKNVYSIFQKMERDAVSIEQIYDIIGFRVIVSSIIECYQALGIIHSIWKPVPGRFRDYIALPKANNYKSLHTTVIGPDGERIEIQIRTQEMHREAEYGIAAHWSYKTKEKINEKDFRKYSWLKEIMDWQIEGSDAKEFYSTVKSDLFTEEIYVFTPKGDVKELPNDSTPLDFAYKVHTEVGNHYAGARVNGKIVSMDYRLKTGDVIEIITSRNQKPRRDWLKFVVTNRARVKIKSSLYKEEREGAIKLGSELLQKELSQAGLTLGEIEKDGRMGKLLQTLSVPNLESLYIEITAQNVVRKIIPQKSDASKNEGVVSSLLNVIPEGISLLKTKVLGEKAGVVIDGESNIVFKFAKCCNPLRGDKIVGHITMGRGISIHTADCPKIIDIDPSRKIQVEWGKEGEHSVISKIKVLCQDRTGLLAEISKAISSMKVNITQANIKTTEDKKALCIFDVEIDNIKKLQKLLKLIEKIDGVMYAQRVKQVSNI